MKLDKFVGIDFPYQVEVATNAGEPLKKITPSGIYITGDLQNSYIHYAGEDAGVSYTSFTLPTNSFF